LPPIALYIAVPIASFRSPRAREYLETLPVPPPSTVYGMLLSLVGERQRRRHIGARLALAMLSQPRRSRVLRSVWRVKSTRSPLGLGENKRPDFQELLCGTRMAAFVESSEDEIVPTLADRLDMALTTPASVTRFGALALGESTHLVDEVRRLRERDLRETAGWLLRDPTGVLALPVWPDHVGSAGTRFEQFTLSDNPRELSATPPQEAWVTIAPP
jgi:CRISPR-associated protein Cas5t